MTHRSEKPLDKSEIRFAVPKNLSTDDKDITFLAHRRDSFRNSGYSYFADFSFGPGIDRVMVECQWISKSIEGLYVAVVKKSGPILPQNSQDVSKKLVSIHFPKPIEVMISSQKVERGKYLHVHKKIYPLILERLIKVEFVKGKGGLTITTSKQNAKNSQLNKGSNPMSPQHSKSAALGLAKKKVPSYASYADPGKEPHENHSTDSIQGSIGSSHQVSGHLAFPSQIARPQMEDKQVFTERGDFQSLDSGRQLTRTAYRVEPMLYTEEKSKINPRSEVKKSQLAKPELVIPVNLDSIRLDTEHRRSFDRDQRTVGLDTIDLRVDNPSQLAKSQSLNPMSLMNNSSASYLIPGNVIDLMNAMKQNMQLSEAMKIKFVDQRVTKPIEAIERTIPPTIPKFSTSLKDSRFIRVGLNNQESFAHGYNQIQPSKGYHDSDKAYEKDDNRNSLENASQKTKSFRIKESKRGGVDSKDQPSQSGVLKTAPEQRRVSQRSDSSDKTRKGTKNSMRSLISGDVNDREQAINSEVKKLEPLIVKYSECNKWSSDKERLRQLVAEQLKQKSPFLGGFSIEFIGNLLALGQFGFHSKDSVLFGEGGTADKMGIVMYGVIKYSLRDSIVTLTHGGMICEECLFNPEPVKTESSVILAKTCVLWLPSNCLQELRVFCDNAKKKNEYVLFVANIQKQIKQKS